MIRLQNITQILITGAVLCAVQIFFVSIASSAIDESELIGPEDLVIVVAPAVPGPNEEVVLGAKNFLTDMRRADIRWFVNGTLEKEGIGETVLSLTTGDVGSRITVRAVAYTFEGDTLSETILLVAGEVDILWQAYTYTPPAYKGKALPTAESKIRLLALPNLVTESGATLLPKTLVYEWRKDGAMMAEVSGYGRQDIVVNASRGGVLNMEVSVSNLTKTLSARRKITIKTVSPELIFYEENALSGTQYGRAIGSEYSPFVNEFQIRAEPYYFSTNDMEGGGVDYKWSLNREEIEGEKHPVITLRKSPDQKGSATVGIDVSNIKNVLQFIRKSLTVNLGV